MLQQIKSFKSISKISLVTLVLVFMSACSDENTTNQSNITPQAATIDTTGQS